MVAALPATAYRVIRLKKLKSTLGASTLAASERLSHLDLGRELSPF